MAQRESVGIRDRVIEASIRDPLQQACESMVAFSTQARPTVVPAARNALACDAGRDFQVAAPMSASEFGLTEPAVTRFTHPLIDRPNDTESMVCRHFQRRRATWRGRTPGGVNLRIAVHRQIDSPTPNSSANRRASRIQGLRGAVGVPVVRQGAHARTTAARPGS